MSLLACLQQLLHDFPLCLVVVRAAGVAPGGLAHLLHGFPLCLLVAVAAVMVVGVAYQP